MAFFVHGKATQTNPWALPINGDVLLFSKRIDAASNRYVRGINPIGWQNDDSKENAADDRDDANDKRDLPSAVVNTPIAPIDFILRGSRGPASAESASDETNDRKGDWNQTKRARPDPSLCVLDRDVQRDDPNDQSEHVPYAANDEVR